MTPSFERGIVVISIDTEQLWGYRDILSEARFQARFPNAVETHTRLLAHLCAARVAATWFVVGALALRDSAGAADSRMAGLLRGDHVPDSGSPSASLWYSPGFLDRLRQACPEQDIGLHGGLTHLVWTASGVTRENARKELREGLKALEQVSKRPCTFSYPRDQEAYHDLLVQNGLRCFRGVSPALSARLGPSVAGAILRVVDEVRRGTPPPVWPHQKLPGLWSIPCSMFLYPIGPARVHAIGLRSRAIRFQRGLECAVRHRGIFHFCLHPENLAESVHGMPLLEDILELVMRWRERGDVEVLTMNDIVKRMEKEQSYAWPKQQPHPDLLEAHRRV